MSGRSDPPPRIGSVKTNLGHPEAAAGIAGLIKVVLVLQHGEIPANLHFTSLNPHISLAGTRLAVPTELTQWDPNGKTRLAGVSSFGWSGTNVHLVLEEAPVRATVARATAPTRDDEAASTASARPFVLPRFGAFAAAHWWRWSIATRKCWGRRAATQLGAVSRDGRPAPDLSRPSHRGGRARCCDVSIRPYRSCGVGRRSDRAWSPARVVLRVSRPGIAVGSEWAVR